jgi:ABC-type nitrate/sulfonate/bicarbonate transport system substrate-binding protein
MIGPPIAARMMQYHATAAVCPAGKLIAPQIWSNLRHRSFDRNHEEKMQTMLYGFLDICRRCFPIFTALLTLASIIAVACNVAADEPKHIRITLARSVSAIPLWGIGPFAEKAGFRVEYIPAGTNADMQRNLQSGIELGTLGYQSAAVMAEQNVTNVKIIAGEQLGGQNLIMRKGIDIKSWKELEGKRIGRPPGSYVAILFTLAAKENGVDISKVNLINTTSAGPAELQALKSGDLDGLVLWSPVLDRAVVEGYGYYPPCCDIGKTEKYGAGNQILAGNTDFLKDRDLTVRFLKAYAGSLDFYVKNPDKAVSLITEYTGVSKDVIAEAWKHGIWDVRADLRTMVNVAKQGPIFGFSKADMSAKVPDYVDMSYLSAATGRPVEQLTRFVN